MSRIRSLLIAVSLSVVVVAGIVFAIHADDAKNRKDADKELADVALETYQVVLKRYSFVGPDERSLDDIYVWSKRAMEAESGRKEAANAHLERMVDLEKFAIKVKDAHQIPPWEVKAATYYRLEAEILAGRFEK